MQHTGTTISKHGLDKVGITNAATVYWNLPPARLYEESIKRNEAVMAADGPLVAYTGNHTGRSPNDKFTVKEPTTADKIWWGKVNRPMSPQHFERIRQKMIEYVDGYDLFVFDGYAGADPNYRIKVRVITQFAWHNLFARNMFIREPDPAVLADFEPDFTVFDCPLFQADPATDGTTSSTVITVNFAEHLVLIGGTRYAGEIKKSIFGALNFYLPQQNVLPMHCSANYGADKQNDVAVFFGLSGTGKTTLSADSSRTLIGDDEHGWSDHGVYNFEGGCYAKTIKITPESEPEIYATTKRMGSILENVVLDDCTRQPDFFDATHTQNTRVSYPIDFIPNADLNGMGGQPKNVIFLTADAFGVLPPISKLTREQTQYHFLNGYTAKVAGTERGVTEPKATFSTCFGAPFMPMHPSVYANMLGDRVEQHGVNVWLVNTGWTGGAYGTGKRMSLTHTRRMVAAALAGELDDVETSEDPFFGLAVPTAIEGVPDHVLMPRQTWDDKDAYDKAAQKLLDMFDKNYQQYKGD